MSTERYNPLKDTAIEHTLKGLSDIKRIQTETGRPGKEAEKIFEEAIHSELAEIREENRSFTKPH